MTWIRVALAHLKGAAAKKAIAAELDHELRSHLELLVDENLRRGIAPAEARRQAMITLGNTTHIQESYRDQAGLPFLDMLGQDLRYAWRMLRRSPAFAAVAIITLALGIGANSAIFSIVNGVLLRPLPFEDPARLMSVFNSSPSRGLQNFGASPPDFRALRERNHTFDGISASYENAFNLTGTPKPERLKGLVVSAEYFRTLGVKPILGRSFLPGDEQWGSHHVLIVSEAFWRSHLDADRDLSGRILNLDGEPYSVVGVMPSSFYTVNSTAQLWAPMAWKPKDNFDSHNNYFLTMVGRLKPGVTQQQAEADLNSIMLSIAQQFPENKGIGAGLQPLHEAWVGDVRPALLVLLGAVGFVLLIACVNLANLMLARSAGRQKEIAIRSALGAGRPRLLRQFMTESVLLALLGGSLGLLLAYLALSLLPMATDILPRMQQIHLDSWVLLFTLAISVVTGVTFGLLPAFQNSRVRKLNDALKEGGRTSEAGSGSGRVRTGLVISEVALALVLLIGSGLALKSFARLLHVDAGFTPTHVLTFSVSLPTSYDPVSDPLRIGAPPRVAAFYRDLLDRIEHLPGVKTAGAISSLPLQGESWGKFFVPLDRPLPTSIDSVPNTQYRSVAGHYFHSIGIRLLKGRLLDERDQANSPLSVVVNETLAQRYWPDQDAIGKTILLSPPESLIPPGLNPPGFHPPQFTIVGVAADVRYGSLDKSPQPVVYGSVLQHDYSMNPSITVRADGDPTALVPSIRSEMAQLDKNLPMASIATMEEIVSTSVAQPRLETLLLGLFGGLAMVLAAIGIYGVISYSVTQRTSEIGIRMALGADRSSVLRMIMGYGLRLAAIGLVIGLVLALAVTRLMSKVLFAVSPTDPFTFAAVVALLTLVALLACYIPARRATKVDPMVALRYE
jgi:putative ABC transport system permease protein